MAQRDAQSFRVPARRPWNPNTKAAPLTMVDFLKALEHLPDGSKGEQLFRWVRRRAMVNLYYPPFANAAAWIDWVRERVASPSMAAEASDVWATFVKWRDARGTGV